MIFNLMSPMGIIIPYRVPVVHSTWYIITVQTHTSMKKPITPFTGTPLPYTKAAIYFTLIVLASTTNIINNI